jgi:carboxylesterase type B
MYSANFTNIMPGEEGAFHTAELPLIMGTHDEARSKSTKFEYEVSHTMQDYWLAFAQNPSAGLTEQGWDPTPVGGPDVVQKGIEFGFNNEIISRKYAWGSLQKTCKRAAATS